MFGSPVQNGPLSARSPTISSSPPRERRLSFSDEFDRNKFSSPKPVLNSNPLAGFFDLASPLPTTNNNLVPPPHLTTPPFNPSKNSSTTLVPTQMSSPISPTPAPVTRTNAKGSFEFGRISLEDLSALSIGLSSPSPLTPKPAPTDFSSLATRSPSQPSSLNISFPSSITPKSPPQIAAGGHPPSTASVLVPTRPTPSVAHPIAPSPTSKSFSFAPSSPNKTVYAPLSPTLGRRDAANGSPGPDGPRRYSEPPPVDTNLLFPGIQISKV